MAALAPFSTASPPAMAGVPVLAHGDRLQIATHPGIFNAPLRPSEATISTVLQISQVQTVSGPILEQATGVLRWRMTHGDLVADAHLVALMIENGERTIWTHDRDYRRFPGIERRDPFSG